MKNKFKLIIFNFLIVIIFMPIFTAVKLYNIQKYGDLPFLEYYTTSWIKLWYLYLIVFFGGCFISKLLEKVIDKLDIKRSKK